MTQQRDAIDNPVTGETIVFLKRAGDTDGQVLQMELLLEADGPRMLEHVHPRQEERIEVVYGTPTLPDDIVEETADRYREAFTRLTGNELQRF